MLKLELPLLTGKYVAMVLRRIAAQRETISVFLQNMDFSGGKNPVVIQRNDHGLSVVRDATGHQQS